MVIEHSSIHDDPQNNNDLMNCEYEFTMAERKDEK